MPSPVFFICRGKLWFSEESSGADWSDLLKIQFPAFRLVPVFSSCWETASSDWSESTFIDDDGVTRSILAISRAFLVLFANPWPILGWNWKNSEKTRKTRKRQKVPLFPYRFRAEWNGDFLGGEKNIPNNAKRRKKKGKERNEKAIWVSVWCRRVGN